MGYLDQGLNDQYAIVLEGDSTSNRYKIVMSADGTVVTSEKTSLGVGVYPVDSEQIETDQNIALSILSLYKKTIRGGTISVGQLIVNMLDHANNHPESFLPVARLPKMTKALATNLASIKEGMVFALDSNEVEFLCFGYRKTIGVALAKNIDPLFIFADRFFTGAGFDTRFKPLNVFMYPPIANGTAVMLTNDTKNLDKISIVMMLDWKRHTEYLEHSLVED